MSGIFKIEKKKKIASLANHLFSMLIWIWESWVKLLLLFHMLGFQIWISSVTQLCLTLCDPMDCSMLGFPVHHQLPELAQTHVHRVSDAIQPSHPLSSSPAFNLSQHQGLFQGVTSLHHVDKVLEFQLQHPVLPMYIQKCFPLGLTGWLSLQSKRLSRVFSNTTVQKH